MCMCSSEVNTCLEKYGRKGSGYHSQVRFFPAQKVKELPVSRTCGQISELHISACVSLSGFGVFTCKGHSCCPGMDAAFCLCQTLWFPPPQTRDNPAVSGTHTPLLASAHVRLQFQTNNCLFIQEKNIRLRAGL